jgi:Ca2+-transporting ATPase
MRFLDKFKDPLIMLLMGSALLSMAVHQYEDALSIAMAVLIVAIVGFAQEYQSEQSLEALNSLVPPRCNVLRGGTFYNVLAEDLVPGDIIKVHSGDRVPADCRVIKCSGLMVDESSLTGESEPKCKQQNALNDVGSNDSISDKANMVFMGTLVRGGNGLCVVCSTGLQTEFGKTFQEMKELESRRTPLQSKMDDLGKNLSVYSMGIIVCICLVGMVQGKSFFAMFNIGVSLAVAAIPEGLPICVAVTLARGVRRMAMSNEIVKKLPAVAALGCVDYVCTDKTGTITQNMMRLCRAYCPALDDQFIIEASANSGNGGSSGSTGGHHVEHYEGGTQFRALYNHQPISVEKFPCLVQLLDAGSMCNNAHISSSEVGGVTGQPTEAGLLLAARGLRIVDRRNHCTRIGESVFSSETRRMSVQYTENSGRGHSSSAGDSEETVVYVKGALEAVLPLCSNYLALNNEVLGLSNGAKDRIAAHSTEMARGGLRVLAIARGRADAEADLQLTFCGVVGMLDPPRPTVADAVHRIQDSGARVMMITGDGPDTAVAIARLVGILSNDIDNGSVTKHILSGNEIEQLARAGEEALAAVIEDVSVCYRTSAIHKLSIVRALQCRGHVVAMTGDGVNDAPALKAADIGVAIGSGTDVAKEASAMVIVDDDFATIAAAIEEGKSIFYNIKNFITFQLSTSIAALSLVALSNVLGHPNPLNPMQILWINIIMDGPLAQSLGVETVDPAVMLRPPRRRTDDILTKPLLMRVLTSGMFILIGTMYVFVEEMEDGAISSRDLSMTFTTFVAFDLFNSFACRHGTRSPFSISCTSNRYYLAALAFCAFGQGLVLYFPPLRAVFRTVALSFWDVCLILLLASSMLGLDYVRKRFFPEVFTEKVSTSSPASAVAAKKFESASFSV